MWNSLRCGILYFEYYNFVYEEISRFIEHVHWKKGNNKPFCAKSRIELTESFASAHYFWPCLMMVVEMSYRCAISKLQCSIWTFMKSNAHCPLTSKFIFCVCNQDMKKTIKMWMWKGGRSLFFSHMIFKQGRASFSRRLPGGAQQIWAK